MELIRLSEAFNYFLFQHLVAGQDLLFEYLLQKHQFSGDLPLAGLVVFFYLHHFAVVARIKNQTLVCFVQNSIYMGRADSILLKNANNQRNQMLYTFFIDPRLISTQTASFILMIVQHQITHSCSHLAYLSPLHLLQHLLPIFLYGTHSTQTIIISRSAFKPMTSCFRFELLLNLRYLEVINIKQSTFFQIRASVYQQGPKEQNHFAVPFLILKSQAETPKAARSNTDPNNAPEIDSSNNTFLTRKMLARNLDDRVQMNEMCVFKGSLLGQRSESNKEIRVYCELLCFQQNEVQVVAEWQGYTRSSNGHSYLPIYFNSYKFTGNLHATIHSVLTAVSIDGLLQNEQAFYSQLKSEGNVQMYRKNTQHLEYPIELLKTQITLFTAHKVSQNYIEEPFNLSTSTYRYAVFLKEKPTKSINQQQEGEVEKVMAGLNRTDFVEKFKEGLHLLNQGVYQLWKKLQILLMTQYSESYEKAVRNRYQDQISQHHRIHSFIIEQMPTPTGEDSLFIYPFEKHDTLIKMSKSSYQRAVSNDKNLKKQLVVFVHGYQASSFDMEPLSNYLKFRQPNVICLLSSVNEGRTEQPIQQSAHRLAIEIKNFVNSLELKQFEISFVCHSLGGLIARACLKYLQLHKEKFKQFISLCSPHLGYLYHSSALISTSLWILNKVKKDPSVIELTLSDAPQLQKTYLYALSSSPELSWFSKIWLFGSRQDEYAPFWSTILEQKSFIFETEAAKIYKKLLQNLTAGIQSKIVRCQIVFNQKSKDLSTFIGRTAHIKILNFIPAIELLFALYTP